jgi:hypothetical protein
LLIYECAIQIVQYRSVRIVKNHGELSSIEIKRKQLNVTIAQSAHDMNDERNEGNEGKKG